MGAVGIVVCGSLLLALWIAGHGSWGVCGFRFAGLGMRVGIAGRCASFFVGRGLLLADRRGLRARDCVLGLRFVVHSSSWIAGFRIACWDCVL